MLSEERQLEITKLVLQRGAITVYELSHIFDASPSTIRRDLAVLSKQRRLNKVFGGATSILSKPPNTNEESLEARRVKNKPDKADIAQAAARLIQPNDIVYLDAGTTTELMCNYISEKDATYVTNSLPLALNLAKNEFKVRLLGGWVKSSTEAIIGSDLRAALASFNFHIGFFGTNGVTTKEGFTTPDLEEAEGKRLALAQCKQAYVLLDASKLGRVAGVTFARLQDVDIITTRLKDTTLREYARGVLEAK